MYKVWIRTVDGNTRDYLCNNNAETIIQSIHNRFENIGPLSTIQMTRYSDIEAQQKDFEMNPEFIFVSHIVSIRSEEIEPEDPKITKETCKRCNGFGMIESSQSSSRPYWKKCDLCDGTGKVGTNDV